MAALIHRRTLRLRSNAGLARRALLSVLALGSGCSFVFAERPPREHHRLTRFTCTEGDGLAAADVALTGAYALLAAAAARSSDSASRRAESVITSAVGAALFGSSAVYGFAVARHCREAQAELRRSTPWAPPAPGWAPPPPGWPPPPPDWAPPPGWAPPPPALVLPPADPPPPGRVPPRADLPPPVGGPPPESRP